MGCHAALEVGIEVHRVLQRLLGGEDHLGRAGRQGFASFRRTRLHQHWPALRRTRHVQGALHRKVLALVVEHMAVCRVEHPTTGLVPHKGVGVPAVPQALHHIGKLAGTFVAVGMGQVVLQVEIARLELAGRGDQVPARSPAAQVVQRGKLARNVKGLIEAGRGRAHQADALGHGRERRQQRERLELRHIAVRGAAQYLRPVAPGAHTVGQKQQVKARRLGDLGQLTVVTDVEPRTGHRVRVAPGRDVVAGGVQKGAKAQKARSFGHGSVSGKGAQGARYSSAKESLKAAGWRKSYRRMLRRLRRISEKER